MFKKMKGIYLMAPHKEKDFVFDYIKDSWDRLDTILGEYCNLIEDKQLLLFKKVIINGKTNAHAATTNQNMIADAAAYTTPELLDDKQAYK